MTNRSSNFGNLESLSNDFPVEASFSMKGLAQLVPMNERMAMRLYPDVALHLSVKFRS